MRAGARRDIGTGTAQSEEAAAPRAQLARHRFTKLSCTEAPATPRSVHTDKLPPEHPSYATRCVLVPVCECARDLATHLGLGDHTEGEASKPREQRQYPCLSAALGHGRPAMARDLDLSEVGSA